MKTLNIPIFIILTATLVVSGFFIFINKAQATTLEVCSGCIHTSIQSAISVAVEGDIINIASGSYTETLNLNGKALTIQGSARDDVIIDASSFTGCAIKNFGDSTIIRGLTLKGTTNDYGFKISHVSDITLENIKVEDSYKTGIDLNTIDGATLNNIEVTDTVAGFGLMILDSNNINIEDIITSGNVWGGVSVQTKNTISNSISFNGIFDVQEDIPLLLEKDPSTYYDITNIDIPSKFEYVVYTFREVHDYRQWLYQESLDSAKLLTQELMDSAIFTYSDSLIYDIAEDNYYVIEEMLIQDAIDAAISGDTINVAAGTYTEQLNIEKSLTITGAGKDNTHIVSPDPTTMEIYDFFGSKGSNQRYIVHRGTNIPVVRIALSDVTFEGFHVDLDEQVFFDVLGTGSDPTYSKGVGILVDHVETTPDIPDHFTGITIQDNMVDGLLWDDYSDCIKVMASAIVDINNNILYGYGESAVSAQGMDTPRAAFYPTVTANDNTMYGGSGAREENHFFFGVGYWSGATGSADGNTIYNAPNGNGYALNSWTPNPVSFTNNVITTDGGSVGGYGAQLYESSNLVFSGNDIEKQGLAGAIWDGNVNDPIITITNNEIINCIDGFIGDGLTAGSVTLHYNNFEGTADGHYALDMVGHGVSIWGSADPSSITANATENYWGDINPSDDVSANVDYSPWYIDNELTSLKAPITTDETGSTVLLTQPINIINDDIIVSMPEGISITATASWQGIINAPSVESVASNTPTPESGYNTTIDTIIEVGYPNIKLVFNKALKILIPNQAGKRVGYTRTGEPFTEITNVCSNDIQPTDDSFLPPEGSCKKDAGNDLVVWTKHFTQFIVYSYSPIIIGPTFRAVRPSEEEPEEEPSPLSEEAQKLDTNKDDKINDLDLGELFTNWGSTILENIADFNNDSKVDVFDFNLLMVHWTE